MKKQLKLELHGFKCCACGEEATKDILIGKYTYHFCIDCYKAERKLRRKESGKQ